MGFNKTKWETLLDGSRIKKFVLAEAIGSRLRGLGFSSCRSLCCAVEWDTPVLQCHASTRSVNCQGYLTKSRGRRGVTKRSSKVFPIRNHLKCRKKAVWRTSKSLKLDWFLFSITTKFFIWCSRYSFSWSSKIYPFSRCSLLSPVSACSWRHMFTPRLDIIFRALISRFL